MLGFEVKKKGYAISLLKKFCAAVLATIHLQDVIQDLMRSLLCSILWYPFFLGRKWKQVVSVTFVGYV